MKSSESETNFQDMIDLLNSTSIKDRETFLIEGAKFEDPCHKLLYNVELGRETYQKIILHANGEFAYSDCPVGLLLFTNVWKVWQLQGKENNNLFIAYNPIYRRNNKWYSNLLKKFPKEVNVKKICGDLVIFRPDAALQWNELVLRRELLNWLVMMYVYGNKYKFCE